MKKFALISVYNKTGIVELAQNLALNHDYHILSTGGTFRLLAENGNLPEDRLVQVSDYTGFEEFLDGRVKTLHPKIHGALLAKRNCAAHMADLERLEIQNIDIVVVNLYPFRETVAKYKDNCDQSDGGSSQSRHDDIVENIDIGGHTLIRAAAKNARDILVVSEPQDYPEIMSATNVADLDHAKFGRKAWHHIRQYDCDICDYFDSIAPRDNSVSNNNSDDSENSSGNNNNCTSGEEEEIPAQISRQYSLAQQFKYGTNPHQKEAGLYTIDVNNISGQSPFQFLNGQPGYINMLDALLGWQLVREIDLTIGECACASYKHNSPAGVGLAVPLSPALHKAYMVGSGSGGNKENNPGLSEEETAFLRARGCDPLSSFGDFVAVNRPVTVALAKRLKREVSDGIIAPGYAHGALEILKSKKGGKFLIIQVDPDFWPETGSSSGDYIGSTLEIREMFGTAIMQARDNSQLLASDFRPANIQTDNCEIDYDPGIIRDLTLASITLKYTQSNSVCLAYDGQTIGIGAGQQNRVACVKLAVEKAKYWFLRQHPQALALNKFYKPKTMRQAKINTVYRFIDGFEFHNAANVVNLKNLNDIGGELSPGNAGKKQAIAEEKFEFLEFMRIFNTEHADFPGGFPSFLTPTQKTTYIRGNFPKISLASDAFFPFPDSIHVAAKIGVDYIVQPGGSSRDAEIVEACNQYGMLMVCTGKRLFTH